MGERADKKQKETARKRQVPEPYVNENSTPHYDKTLQNTLHKIATSGDEPVNPKLLSPDTIMFLQRTIGNQAVLNLINKRQVGAPQLPRQIARLPATTRRGGMQVQRGFGDVLSNTGSAGEAIQREPAPQQATPEIKFRIGWLTDEGLPVETNGQVAALARLTIASLQDDLDSVDSNSVKTQVTEWITTVKGVLPYFDQHADERSTRTSSR